MAQLTVQLKRLSKKKVRTVAYDLPANVHNLEELLAAIVTQEVSAYNERRRETSLLPFLTPADIQEQSSTGKVGFGDISNRTEADVATAIEAARIGFKDGLYTVFLDDNELRALNELVRLTDTSTLTFIRLTFLTGTYW